MNNISMNGGPGGSQPVDRTRPAQDARKAADAARTTGAQAAEQPTENVQQAPVQGVRDVFERTADPSQVKKLADEAAEAPDAPPRDERVAAAKARAASGYYSSPDMARTIADTLINTGTVQ